MTAYHIKVERRPMATAILEGMPGAADALMGAFMAANGEDVETGCECFTCSSRWAMDRAPVLYMFIEWLALEPDSGVVGLVCEECCGRANLVVALDNSIKTTFGLDTIQMVHPQEGRA
jgi:hypothetical protein